MNSKDLHGKQLDIYGCHNFALVIISVSVSLYVKRNLNQLKQLKGVYWLERNPDLGRIVCENWSRSLTMSPVSFTLLCLELWQLLLRLVLFTTVECLAATTRVRWILILISLGEKTLAFSTPQSFLLLRLACVTCSPLNQSQGSGWLRPISSKWGKVRNTQIM